MTSYTSPSRKDPYLSIVVTSRNDDHGGDILKRTELFQRGLLEQSRHYHFPIEIVFVEWNPPVDRPRLHEVLPKPAENDCLLVRYITVPNEIHRQYRRAPDIDLFQMTAKNVGIRRARGAFILCANVDLLFSDSLFRALTEMSFKADTYYRANRCDVPDGIDPQWDLDQQLAWCERNTIRRLGRDPRYKNINLELVGLQGKGRALKWFLDKMALSISFYWSPEKQLFHQLDLFACGDFTLMSREAWNAIQGYLELDLYSLHIDSLGLIAAAALGYKQHVFPLQACTYHIDHPRGWETLAPLDKVKFLADRPALDYSLIQEVALHALEKKEPFNLNPPTWGFSDVELEEFVFCPPSAAVAHNLAHSASSGG